MPAIPSLSQIRTWDTDHLHRAAGYWSWGAEHWESVFTTVYQASARPGGHPWEGSAADQAQLRAYLDRMKVIDVADRIRAAADAARAGATRIEAARRRALDIVDEAMVTGFAVGEDLSVSDRHRLPVPGAARQIQAELLAARLRSAATELASSDSEVAASIADCGVGVDSLDFGDEHVGDPHLDDITTPPPDSLKGGGYWSLDTSKAYDDPEPIVGPLAVFDQTFASDDENPARTGDRSPLVDVVAPNNPGRGSEPIARLQESWQLQLAGRSFNGSFDHVRWVRENGKWYRARWMDYRFTGVRQLGVASELDLLHPLNDMGFSGRPRSLSIQDVYRISNKNTRLTLSVPDICGKPTLIGSDAPSTLMPATPDMRAPR